MQIKEQDDHIMKKGILGFLIGLAVIIPGVSGSTIAIIFKLYHKILNAIANIHKKFKKSILFLFPILIGAILGLVIGLASIQKLLDFMPFVMICLFAGLMVGAMPSLYDEVIKTKTRLQKKHILYLFVGILIPLCFTLFPILKSAPQQELNVDFISILCYLVIGFLVALTQFIPGGSSTALLMSLGYFIPLMNSLHISYIMENPMILMIYVSLFIGFVVGAFLISKVLNGWIEKYKRKMYILFLGLSIGSILCLFFNADMIKIYEAWEIGTNHLYLELLLGGTLFVFGGYTSYQLVLYTRKRSRKSID